jgi:hopene-associated glycosyltransferase HpnB
MIELWLASGAAAFWCLILMLPWQPWRTREYLDADPSLADCPFDSLTVLIPARNEAETLPRTLETLTEQSPRLAVVVVDDQSDDATAEIVSRYQQPSLTLVQGKPLPPGWNGKLWALEQGRKIIRTELTLLLDADIALAPDMLKTMLNSFHRRRLDLLSLMANLRMISFWEKLLLPAFIFFFKLLYPFSLANNARWPKMAAAAGGCILIRSKVLEEIGGFGGVRGELIDDCALARAVKRRGHRIWVGLSHSVTSHRRYDRLQTIWDMVSRTAYTQLRYSPALLLGLSLVFLLAFWVPMVSIGYASSPATNIIAAAALLAMAVSYLPTLRFYRRSPFWALTMPVIGTLFLGMTWTSAARFWQGERSSWKKRVYTKRLEGK